MKSSLLHVRFLCSVVLPTYYIQIYSIYYYPFNILSTSLLIDVKFLAQFKCLVEVNGLRWAKLQDGLQMVILEKVIFFIIIFKRLLFNKKLSNYDIFYG